MIFLTELDNYGRIEDIVVSTRVRIARNLDKYKFPQSMNIKESKAMTESILNIIKESGAEYKYYSIRDLDEMEKTSLVEDHLISPTLYNSVLRGSFLLREDREVTIMLNEEDHIRIQVLLPGFRMEDGWKLASNIDDVIEDKVDYAFSEKFGYLTSCPTNVGTGLRVSAMVHLPGIELTNHLQELVEILRRVGLTLRGIYGEGTKGLGSLYQISNQTTLGQGEEEIISKLQKIVRQVIDRERETRKFLMENGRIELEDKIIRSCGLLRYNRKMSSEEAMSYLSDIKLGVDLGILDNADNKNIVDLMVNIQPGKLQCNLKEKLGKKERDIERSKYLREFFKEEE